MLILIFLIACRLGKEYLDQNRPKTQAEIIAAAEYEMRQRAHIYAAAAAQEQLRLNRAKEYDKILADRARENATVQAEKWGSTVEETSNGGFIVNSPPGKDWGRYVWPKKATLPNYECTPNTEPIGPIMDVRPEPVAA